MSDPLEGGGDTPMSDPTRGLVAMVIGVESIILVALGEPTLATAIASSALYLAGLNLLMRSRITPSRPRPTGETL